MAKFQQPPLPDMPGSLQTGGYLTGGGDRNINLSGPSNTGWSWGGKLLVAIAILAISSMVGIWILMATGTNGDTQQPTQVHETEGD